MNDILKQIRRQQISDIILLAIVALAIFAFLAFTFSASGQEAKKPLATDTIKEATTKPKPIAPAVWLSPARLAQLKQATDKPRIIATAPASSTTTSYTWTDGKRTWTTTEPNKQVLGAKSTNAWQDKIDVERAAKEEILTDLKAVASGKVSKAAIDNVIQKAEAKTVKQMAK